MSRRRIVRSAIAEAVSELSWSNDDLEIETDADWIEYRDWDDYLDAVANAASPEPLVVPFIDGIRTR